LVSLRPECIRIAQTAPLSAEPGTETVRFSATLRDQAFHGATELLRVESDGGLSLTVRTSSQLGNDGQLAFEFSAVDAVPVRETELSSEARFRPVGEGHR